jgi:hypothetical protein
VILHIAIAIIIILQGSSYLSWAVHSAALHGDQCTTSCKVDMNFADESIYLLANKIQNEIVTIHGSQDVLKMLSLYTYTFLAPADEVLIYLMKLICRNICNFTTNIFFQKKKSQR